jgi:Ohr subfamily peroxiredoxin
MEPLHTAIVTAKGGREGYVKAEKGVIDMPLTMPKALGGKGEGAGTNPEELFAAGYAACFESALRLVARRQDRELPQDVAVTAEVSIGKEGEGFALAVRLATSAYETRKRGDGDGNSALVGHSDPRVARRKVLAVPGDEQRSFHLPRCPDYRIRQLDPTLATDRDRALGNPQAQVEDLEPVEEVARPRLQLRRGSDQHFGPADDADPAIGETAKLFFGRSHAQQVVNQDVRIENRFQPGHSARIRSR